MTTTTATQTVSLEIFLTLAACVIRNKGFVSGAMAKESGEITTGAIAWEWAVNGRNSETKNFSVLSEDKVTAHMVAKWMAEIQPSVNNSYMTTLLGIGKSTVVSEKEIGYAASAIKAMEKESAPKDKSLFLGAEKEKFSTTLKFVGSSSGIGKFGVWYKHAFTDVDGRNVIWFASKSLEQLGLESGNSYQVKGTVKKCSTYGKNHQTEITRATVEPIKS